MNRCRRTHSAAPRRSLPESVRIATRLALRAAVPLLLLAFAASLTGCAKEMPEAEEREESAPAGVPAERDKPRAAPAPAAPRAPRPIPKEAEPPREASEPPDEEEEAESEEPMTAAPSQEIPPGAVRGEEAEAEEPMGAAPSDEITPAAVPGDRDSADDRADRLSRMTRPLGTSYRPTPPSEAAPREAERPTLVSKELRFVKVFYGTNRRRAPVCDEVRSTTWDAGIECTPNGFYGHDVASPPPDRPEETGLEVGTFTVTFPPEHHTGEIERPPQIFSFTLREEDPEKDVLIASLRSFSNDYDGWVREVRATGRDQAFIYVHGYGNTFADAARRAAQVAYDLDFDVDDEFQGLTMMYSWPSRGEVTPTAYNVDVEASEDAVESFNHFLDLVKERAGVRRVHVIAHSMGNRLVANAFRARDPRRIVDQLVLAAPDVWASQFKNRFLRTLPEFADRVTLYVSDEDRALKASRTLHAGEPRAGEVQGGLLEESAGVERFDAIDATNLKSDFLGHSYYASSNSMLSDIYCLLKGLPPENRPCIAPTRDAWAFRPLDELAELGQIACKAPTFPAPPESSRWWIGPLIVLALAAVVTIALRLRRRTQPA